MKKFIALSFFLLMGSAVYAQDANVEKMLRTKTLLEQLELNEEQKKEFQAIREKYQNLKTEYRKSFQGDRSAFASEIGKFDARQVEEIRNILDDGQRDAFDTLKKQQMKKPESEEKEIRD